MAFCGTDGGRADREMMTLDWDMPCPSTTRGPFPSSPPLATAYTLLINHAYNRQQNCLLALPSVAVRRWRA